jgi:glycerophosphoryl diester phosphodiesterase
MRLLLSLIAAAGGDAPAGCRPADSPIVIAHRGASGERPEHTIEAYRLAVAQGADYIEPDLVMTRDGALIARHENELSDTTDIADRPEFAGRRTTRTIDGQAVTGWFSEDLTLAELKTLRARERLPQLRPANAAYDGRNDIPTFAEVLAFARAESARTGRTVGVYPELKHPAYFAGIGLPMEAALLRDLAEAGLSGADAPVFVQSFEVEVLRRLRAASALRLVQLVAESGAPADRPDLPYAAMLSGAGLAAIATYAQGIGPAKGLIVPRTADGRLGTPTDLVARARAAGLAVHPWTFRSENHFLAAEHRGPGGPAARGDAAAEHLLFYCLGVDGLFSDQPADAVAARAALPTGAGGR